MSDDDKPSDLKTKFVFLDTQAFVAGKSNWDGKHCARIEQLAREGKIYILTTDITIREVKRKIREALDAAAQAIGKHSVVLGQLGIRHRPLEFEPLEKQFDDYLRRANVNVITRVTSMDKILDDYFERRPRSLKNQRSFRTQSS